MEILNRFLKKKKKSNFIPVSLEYSNILKKMLEDLKGRYRGGRFSFIANGYTDQLYSGLGGRGWSKVEGFSDYPGMRDFADDLNEAIQPVVDKHYILIKQELIRELARLGTDLGDE